MDDGRGRFQMFDANGEGADAKMRKKFPDAKGIFQVGEELDIKGSRFKIKKITPFGITMKLLKGE